MTQNVHFLDINKGLSKDPLIEELDEILSKVDRLNKRVDNIIDEFDLSRQTANCKHTDDPNYFRMQ